MSIDTPQITPQQYEVLHGRGAEAAEIARQRLSRRRFLRRSILGVWGLATAASVAGAIGMLYPNLAGQFGTPINVGKKKEFPAALPSNFKLDQVGVFHRPNVKIYIVHLANGTQFLLHGHKLEDQLASEYIVKDSDGSYWIALYHRCVHLGCIVPFRDDCNSFKCPCHGSHYNVDGEWLGKPAPRSMDRFALSLIGEDLIIDTGLLNNTVPIPDDTARLISIKTAGCWA